MYISKKSYKELVESRDNWKRLAEDAAALCNRTLETNETLMRKIYEATLPKKCPWCGQLHT